MNKFFLLALCWGFCLTILAQEDVGRVSISAVQPDYEHIPEEARVNLETKMQRIISNCGLASNASDRFIMTARIDVVNREINSVGMIVQRMEVTFIIGDIIKDKVYGTTTINALGIGETEAKSFIKAFQSIKPNDPLLTAFVKKGKEDIVSYYTNNCQFIIQDADRMAGVQKYDEAISSLVAVPKVCTECYMQCQTKAIDIYNMQIEHEGKNLIQDARSVWLVKRDYDCAAKALEILSKINPSALCVAEADALIKEINNQLRETEAAAAAAAKERWEFKKKQYEDNMEFARQKQADKTAILGALVNRVGRIDMVKKKEHAFKLGSVSK